jgi:hypothetical protein
VNVRIRRHQFPQRTYMWGGIIRVYSDGSYLQLFSRDDLVRLQLWTVAEILLDDDGCVS